MAQNNNTDISGASAAVAIALIVLVGAIVVVAIFQYTVDDALKIWNTLTALVGILTGAIVTYFFTRQTVNDAKVLSETSIRTANTVLQKVDTAADQANTVLQKAATAIQDANGAANLVRILEQSITNSNRAEAILSEVYRALKDIDSLPDFPSLQSFTQAEPAAVQIALNTLLKRVQTQNP